MESFEERLAFKHLHSNYPYKAWSVRLTMAHMNTCYSYRVLGHAPPVMRLWKGPSHVRLITPGCFNYRRAGVIDCSWLWIARAAPTDDTRATMILSVRQTVITRFNCSGLSTRRWLALFNCFFKTLGRNVGVAWMKMIRWNSSVVFFSIRLSCVLNFKVMVFQFTDC